MVRSTTVAILVSMLAVMIALYPIDGFAQSTLPPCPIEEDHAQYDACFGTSILDVGYKYTGEWKNGTRDGIGTLILENGDIFVGEWQNDKRNGHGNYNWEDGTKHVGNYKDDKRNGKGIETFADGATYFGDYKDGLQSGLGIFTYGTTSFEYRAKYVGEFKANRYHGNGTLYAANGNVLKSGIWENDDLVTITAGFDKSTLPQCPNDQTQRYDNCFGTFTFPDGESYLGEWKDDKLDGKGTYTYTDGAKYAGEFNDGKRNGLGTFLFPDGENYVGEFKDGSFHGQASYTYADGRIYVGEFKENKENGLGIYKWPDGREYVGEYKDGNRNGKGTYTFPNGERYVGGFRDGNYNGTGTLYAADGSIITFGTWENNELVVLDSGICDESYLRANAIFIRATANYCTKNYMDSPAGYFALEKARACQSIGEAALQSKAIDAMTELDGEAIKRGNTAVCQWVDEIENSVNEAAAAEGWPSAPEDVTQPETLGEVRGWTITYDGSGDGACYASAEYVSDTTLTVGQLGPNASWLIQIVNPKWSSIVVGSQYDTSYVFNGRNTWTGADTGIENGIRSEGLTEDFIVAFARSSSLELRLKDKRVDGFDLTGTRAASDAVAQCYKDRVETADPFAPQ